MEKFFNSFNQFTLRVKKCSTLIFILAVILSTIWLMANNLTGFLKEANDLSTQTKVTLVETAHEIVTNKELTIPEKDYLLDYTITEKPHYYLVTLEGSFGNSLYLKMSKDFIIVYQKLSDCFILFLLLLYGLLLFIVYYGLKLILTIISGLTGLNIYLIKKFKLRKLKN